MSRTPEPTQLWDFNYAEKLRSILLLGGSLIVLLPRKGLLRELNPGPLAP